MAGFLSELSQSILGEALPRTTLSLENLFPGEKQNILSMYIHGALRQGMTRSATKAFIRSQGIKFTNHPFNVLYSLIRRANLAQPFIENLKSDEIVPLEFLSPKYRKMTDNIYYYVKQTYENTMTGQLFDQYVTVVASRPLSIFEILTRSYNKIQLGKTMETTSGQVVGDANQIDQAVIGGMVNTSYYEGFIQ